jgi:hypothetical protein
MSFKTRFKISECIDRNPKSQCPYCKTINQVGIYYDGEELRLNDRVEDVEILIEEW